MADGILRIAHLTTAHPRDDVRIFLKECRSLATAGYSVHLVVADNNGDAIQDGVNIHDIGKKGGRLARVFSSTRKALKEALRLNANIYHLHDPELLWVGLVLSMKGKAVVFDVHEDVPLQLLNKPYLSPIILKILSRLYAKFERFASRRFAGIVAATPFIGAKFREINLNTVVVCNYPILNEFANYENWDKKQDEVCYVGSLSHYRGLGEMVAAMGLVKHGVILNLVGDFSEPTLRDEVKVIPGWANVVEHGLQGRAGVGNVYERSRAGLVTLLPIPNYLDALPIKMFEYMSAGLPVIASNFSLWREIVEGNKCGLCVDPKNSVEIASAIDYIISNPTEAQVMGRNGQQAVMTRYNWRNEEKVLMDFYQHFADTQPRCVGAH